MNFSHGLDQYQVTDFGERIRSNKISDLVCFFPPAHIYLVCLYKTVLKKNSPFLLRIPSNSGAGWATQPLGSTTEIQQSTKCGNAFSTWKEGLENEGQPFPLPREGEQGARTEPSMHPCLPGRVQTLTIIWYKGVATAEAVQWKWPKVEGNTLKKRKKKWQYLQLKIIICMVKYIYIHLYVWFIFPLFIFCLFIAKCCPDENEPVT